MPSAVEMDALREELQERRDALADIPVSQRVKLFVLDHITTVRSACHAGCIQMPALLHWLYCVTHIRQPLTPNP